MKLNEVIQKQKNFQVLVDFPFECLREVERNEASEKYLFKAIEEIIELRKEFPSAINPWSKIQKFADMSRVKEEFCDVLLFLINFMNVWKFTPEELFETLISVQQNNFNSIKQKKMDTLNVEILKIPGYTSGIGSGSINPKYVFVGQNPGKGITKGYKFWSNKEDGSSKILLPILEDLGILKDCYLTNYVKSTTKDNDIPTDEIASFWDEFYRKEIAILSVNNPNIRIISMGKWTGEKLKETRNIHHPGYFFHQGSAENYKKEIYDAIK